MIPNYYEITSKNKVWNQSVQLWYLHHPASGSSLLDLICVTVDRARSMINDHRHVQPRLIVLIYFLQALAKKLARQAAVRELMPIHSPLTYRLLLMPG